MPNGIAVFDPGPSATVSTWLPPSPAEKHVPRYFFNVYDGVSLLDITGTELLDWREARVEAIRLAGAIFQDNAKTIALGDDWRIEVTDERQLVLFRFDFISQEAPVLSSQRRTPIKPS
jgi:hypothetical protein